MIMQKKEVISAFILTKNSEKTIERTLKSIVPFVGNIIVLDTGSTDKTVQCCLQYGCTVWYDSWKEDFSYSRNLAKRYCKTPWLLMIDSDEELAYFDEQTFLDHYQNPLIGGISVTIINYLDEHNETFTKHTYSRLFRNHHQIVFEGSIHEQISPSIEREGFEIMPSSIEIAHYGYKENNEEKRHRNLMLLQNEFAKNQDDYLAYQLLQTYFADKNLQMVIQIGEKIRSSISLSLQQKELVTLRMGQALLQQSAFKEMKQLLTMEMTTAEYEFFRKYLVVVMNMQIHNFTQAKNDISYLRSNFQPGMVSMQEVMKLESILLLV